MSKRREGFILVADNNKKKNKRIITCRNLILMNKGEA